MTRVWELPPEAPWVTSNPRPGVNPAAPLAVILRPLLGQVAQLQLSPLQPLRHRCRVRPGARSREAALFRHVPHLRPPVTSPRQMFGDRAVASITDERKTGCCWNGGLVRPESLVSSAEDGRRETPTQLPELREGAQLDRGAHEAGAPRAAVTPQKLEVSTAPSPRGCRGSVTAGSRLLVSRSGGVEPWGLEPPSGVLHDGPWRAQPCTHRRPQHAAPAGWPSQLGAAAAAAGAAWRAVCAGGCMGSGVTVSADGHR